MKRRGLTQFSRLYLFWTLRITFFFPPVGRWLARPGPARPGPARLGSARSYTRNPPVFPLARVISRFNGLASVPGVGINFNRSYLDRANIEKFMRTGLCLFLYLLSLSLFLVLFRAETGSKIPLLASTPCTRLVSTRRSTRRGTRKGGLFSRRRYECWKGEKSGGDEKLADAFVEFDSK